MFSYIYADSRGVNQILASRTKDGIKRQAFEYIRQMATGDVPFDKARNPETLQEPKELKAVFDALTAQDIDKTMTAWNTYQAITYQNVISCHRIEEIKLVE